MIWAKSASACKTPIVIEIQVLFQRLRPIPGDLWPHCARARTNRKYQSRGRRPVSLLLIDMDGMVSRAVTHETI